MQETICRFNIMLTKVKCLVIINNILRRNICVLWFALVWGLFFFFCGCGAFFTPTDYYEKTIEMEAHGGQKSSQTENTAKEAKPEKIETTKIIRKGSEEAPMVDVLPKPPQKESDLAGSGQKDNEVDTQDKTAEVSSTSLPDTYLPEQGSESISESITISSDVIKSALEIAGINVRNVELVNRRIGGGKNSVRVSFICESDNVVNDKFFTICAVIYHLNKSSKTVDVVVGIAEDSQSNLLGALQSNTEDITAWMDNKITRAEWFSRISRKML